MLLFEIILGKVYCYLTKIEMDILAENNNDVGKFRMDGKQRPMLKRLNTLQNIVRLLVTLSPA